MKKGNVANQREHLILLLANMNIGDRAESSHQVAIISCKSAKSFCVSGFFSYFMDRIMLNLNVVITFPLIVLNANKNLVAAPLRNCRKVEGYNLKKL